MNSRLHVVLIDTCPEGLKGSMAHYGDMVKDALNDFEERSELQVERVRLSLPAHLLDYIPAVLRYRMNHLWMMMSARVRLKKYKPDIFHVLDGSHAYVTESLHNVPVVITSHDLIPALQLFGYLSPRPSTLARWLIQRSLKGLKHADRIVSDSNNTAVDLGRVTDISSEKIDVVYLAIAPDYTMAHGKFPFSGDRRRDGVYILHVGNNAFYKNREGVLRIFSYIRKQCDVRVKMAGPPPTKELLSLTDRLGISKHVEFIVNPEGPDLVDLYQSASLFLFPSIYEGFGWPPLEAMSCGCPVVCSDAASLPEVVGDAALKCPAHDEEQMALNCLSVLCDPELARDLVQRGFVQAGKFTLEKMRANLFRIYSETAKVNDAKGRVSNA